MLALGRPPWGFDEPIVTHPESSGVNTWDVGVSKGMYCFYYQPSVPFHHLVPMLKWRKGTLRGHTPRSLAASLTVEGLPYDKIPPKHYEAVKGFRRRNHKARAALCRRFLRQIQGV